MKYVKIGIALLFLFFLAFPIHAESTVVDVVFFWGEGCPHCAKEKAFLPTLQEEFGGQINVRSYEVYYSSENQELFAAYADQAGQDVEGVPTTFIGDTMIVGYGSDATTGQEIRDAINEELRKAYAEPTEPAETPPEEADEAETVQLPYFGNINPTLFSLPLLTVVVAAVDGFNPCAMWVLVLLIGMLIGMQDRKRLWILGLSFIAASAAVYFVFLAAWFNFFRFVGAVRWIQVVIGIAALGIGVYYIRRFFTTKGDECKVTNPGQKKKISERMLAVVNRRSLGLALVGIIALAILVNTIELACSAGLPAVYTQVLALHELSTFQHYAYLVLYVLIFMLDDMLIFAIAVTTFKSIGLSGKYSHIASIVGGIVVLIIGLLLIVRPQWVMLG